MGVDYFNCTRCNDLICDCGEYISCKCGAGYCVECDEELHLYELFGKNEDGQLHFCFYCYHFSLKNDKKFSEYDKKIKKYEKLIEKTKDAKEKYIIKYQKKHKLKPQIDDDKDDIKEEKKQ